MKNAFYKIKVLILGGMLICFACCVQAQSVCDKPVLLVTDGSSIIYPVRSEWHPSSLKLKLIGLRECIQPFRYSFSQVEIIWARGTMRVKTEIFKSREVDLSAWNDTISWNEFAKDVKGLISGDRVIFSFAGVVDDQTKQERKEATVFVWYID